MKILISAITLLLLVQDVLADCSGAITELVDQTGIIVAPVDPARPGRYPRWSNCQWSIVGPEESIISIQFSSFNVRYSYRCRRDYMLIQDGNNGPTYKLCGNYVSPFATSSNIIHITFRSDRYTSRYDIGFSLVYRMIATDFGDECQNPGLLSAITDSYQTAFTPGFSNMGYGINMQCSWLITAAEDHQMQLRFTTFFLEHESMCRYDSISVYNGGDATATLIGTYCGDQSLPGHASTLPPDVIKSSGKTLFIVFQSDESVIDTGAEWEYVAIAPDNIDPGTDDACDGTAVTLTDESGEINSPLAGDGMYYNNAMCEWVITTTDNMVIAIDFDALDIEDGGSDCIYDHVEIRDTGSDEVLELVCGSDAAQGLPGEIVSMTNSVTVKFKTDATVRGYGFSLDYETREKPTMPSCGVSSVTIKPQAIVGGADATAHSLPWQISLRRYSRYGWYHSCGGVVIGIKWVLTAAHCIYGVRVQLLRVRIGEHDRNIGEGTESDLVVRRIIRHPSYNTNTLANDIALLELSSEITYSDIVRPVCLPEAAAILAAGTNNALISGWGSTQGTGNENILQQAYVDVFSTSLCRSRLGRAFQSTVMICAGKIAGGIDSCFGDSGGPLVVQEGQGYTLYGLVSWGYGCAQAGRPGVYTKVSHYVNWITGITGP